MDNSDEEIYGVVADLLEFPNAKMCKHHAALTIIDRLVDNPSEDLVKAIVDGDDEKALSILTSN